MSRNKGGIMQEYSEEWKEEQGDHIETDVETPAEGITAECGITEGWRDMYQSIEHTEVFLDKFSPILHISQLYDHAKFDVDRGFKLVVDAIEVAKQAALDAQRGRHDILDYQTYVTEAKSIVDATVLATITLAEAIRVCKKVEAAYLRTESDRCGS